jgi:hypothetical protein
LTAAGLRTAESYERRGQIRSALAVTAAIALSATYSVLTVATNGEPLLALGVVGALAIVAVFARPATGIYLAITAALLFEQWAVPGIDPLTAQTHFFDNVSSFTSIDLRSSPADLLIITCVLAWLLRRDRENEPLRAGPLGWAVAAYGAAFIGGVGVGLAHGGGFNMIAALAELRGPLYFCALYFLTANLVRTRAQLVTVALLFGGLVGLKAFQAVANTGVMLNAGLRLEAVTSHEDVIFFDVALALALAAVVLVGRSRMTYLLVAMVPAIILAELFTSRRVAFIALVAVFIVVSQLLFVARRRTMVWIVALATVGSIGYGAVFWEFLRSRCAR